MPYAREGAKVFCVDSRLEAADETVAIIHGEGNDAVSFRADVSCSDDLRAMAAACVARYGRIDVLHNNVGIVEAGGPVETSEESWARVIAVNQTSVFLSCKHVPPIMIAQRSGSIVNIGSVASIRWIGFLYLAYSAAHAALLAMTSNVAVQYARRASAPTACCPD